LEKEEEGRGEHYKSIADQQMKSYDTGGEKEGRERAF